MKAESGIAFLTGESAAGAAKRLAAEKQKSISEARIVAKNKVIGVAGEGYRLLVRINPPPAVSSALCPISMVNPD
jgi:hypothetical protein